MSASSNLVSEEAANLIFLAYPEEAVLGPTVLDVPIEELFFFVVQTYIVSLREILRYLF